jgi:hypothetical protein
MTRHSPGSSGGGVDHTGGDACAGVTVGAALGGGAYESVSRGVGLVWAVPLTEGELAVGSPDGTRRPAHAIRNMLANTASNVLCSARMEAATEPSDLS